MYCVDIAERVALLQITVVTKLFDEKAAHVLAAFNRKFKDNQFFPSNYEGERKDFCHFDVTNDT